MVLGYRRWDEDRDEYDSDYPPPMRDPYNRSLPSVYGAPHYDVRESPAPRIRSVEELNDYFEGAHDTQENRERYRIMRADIEQYERLSREQETKRLLNEDIRRNLRGGSPYDHDPRPLWMSPAEARQPEPLPPAYKAPKPRERPFDARTIEVCDWKPSMRPDESAYGDAPATTAGPKKNIWEG